MISRLFGLAIAGLAYIMGYYENSGEFIRMAAEWQWWGLTWIFAPLFVVICTIFIGIFIVAGATHGKLAAFGGGMFGTTIAGVFAIGLALQFVEAWLLWKAYEVSTSVTQFNIEYLYMWLGVVVLNTLMGLIRSRSSSSTSTSKD